MTKNGDAAGRRDGAAVPPTGNEKTREIQMSYLFLRRTVAFGLILGFGFPLGAMAADLALKRVALSSGGVAYYEHEAVVEGDAVLNLDVRLDQVDDVLKSIVVYDDKGGVGSIRLPGREPLTQIFRDLPFSEEDLASPAQLLARLQGAEIEVSGQNKVRGRILSVVAETTRGEDKTQTVHHRVSLMTPTGVQQFVLETAGAVRFVDDKLGHDVDGALQATALHRVADRRTLSIETRGKAKRTVRVGYVVAAPIWKTSYRLTVTDGSGKGTLQGWAVLENQSGHDWNGVELTLVSGNPVTFRQALYESYYVERPEVPVDVAGHVLPSVDSGAMAAKSVAAAAENRAMKSAPPGTAMLREYAERMPIPEAPVMAYAPPAPAPARAAEKTETTEAATQVLFRLARPVTVTAGNSLVVPIVDRDIPAARLGLFERRTNGLHPLVAIRLTNDGESSLPAGVFTVYERSGPTAEVAFVGDARIGVLPKGEERFASFALDPRIRIDAERTGATVFRRASVSKGVLTYVSAARETTIYRIAEPIEAQLPVVIQHPRREGWTLVEPDPKAAQETSAAYRITATPGADGKAAVTVVLEHINQETIAITGITSDRLLAFSQEGALPAAMKKAFQEVARLKATLETLERSAAAIDKERETIVEDQERVRENLGAAPKGSDLQSRYQKKLASQEDRLEAIDKTVAENAAKIAKARDDLATFIAGMDFQP